MTLLRNDNHCRSPIRGHVIYSLLVTLQRSYQLVIHLFLVRSEPLMQCRIKRFTFCRGFFDSLFLQCMFQTFKNHLDTFFSNLHLAHQILLLLKARSKLSIEGNNFWLNLVNDIFALLSFVLPRFAILAIPALARKTCLPFHQIPAWRFCKFICFFFHF